MSDRIIALSGGIGGAKLALGLSRLLRPDGLLIVANTGDDFEHLGYTICPDIDTLLYTLGGISNPDTGWGRAGETWNFMDRLRREDPDQAWFLLGDKDLETHRLRAARLAAGKSLSAITAELAARFGVEHRVVPMSDDAVRTRVLAETESGTEWLQFQEYFVRLRCAPVIRRLEYRRASNASVQAELRRCLEQGGARAVVICPSNPFLSIDPMLSLPGFRQLLADCGAPVIAVSPVVGGRALKGPTAKIMQELGMEPGVEAVARHYRGVINGMVIDRHDRASRGRLRALGLEVSVTDTVMQSLEDKVRLAQQVLDTVDGRFRDR